jgi:hypothetical protein
MYCLLHLYCLQCMDVARKSFTATGSEDRRWQGLVLASCVAGMVQHAASEFVSAGESFGAGAGGLRCTR